MKTYRTLFLLVAALLLTGLLTACPGSDSDGNNNNNNTNPSKTISSDPIANTDLLTTFTGANSVTVSGSWTNETFSSTGAVRADISFDTATNVLTFIYDIDGNVYGGSDPASETYTVDLTDFINNGTMTYSDTSATYGDFTIELNYYTDGTGTFSGTATNEPSGSVDNASFSGSFTLSGNAVTFLLDKFTFDYLGTTVTCSSNVSATIN